MAARQSGRESHWDLFSNSWLFRTLDFVFDFTYNRIMHPLISNLSELSDTDFQRNLGKLLRMITQGHRLGFSADYLGQLNMLYQTYLEEQQRRQFELLRKTQEEAEKNRKDPDYSDKIQIR